MFILKLNLILLPQPTDTLNNYPSPVYPTLNVNQSAFLEGILLTLQSHKQNNGTNGRRQLGSGDQKLLPLLTRHLCGILQCGMGHCLCIWMLHGCPNKSYLPPPIPPTLSVNYTDIRKNSKNTRKFSHQRFYWKSQTSYYKSQQILLLNTHKHNNKLRLGFCN